MDLQGKRRPEALLYPKQVMKRIRHITECRYWLTMGLCFTTIRPSFRMWNAR